MLLRESLRSDFQNGLPTSYFDFAPLWTPGGTQRRIPEFPSWSWCGWSGAVEYKYQSLEGVLTNLHEWLASRTWIDWYVRAGDIDPKYVWDGAQNGIAGRWKGYRYHDSEHPYGRLNTHPGKPSDLQNDAKRILGGRPEDVERNQSILQFFTHSAHFSLDTEASPRQLEGGVDDPNLSWYSLSDAECDWCGTVLLSQDQVDILDTEQCELIAVSEAKDFSTEEHDSWTYYVPRDRVDSQWDIYYVLLIVPVGGGLYERVGCGKVFKDAFQKSRKPGYSWREVFLV